MCVNRELLFLNFMAVTLDDEGLLDHVPENKPRWLSRSHDMDIDEHDDCINEMTTDRAEGGDAEEKHNSSY